MKINNMCGNSKIWFDIYFLNGWYVFIWRKGFWPSFYYSLDATPPNDRNKGYWFFGFNSGSV